MKTQVFISAASALLLAGSNNFAAAQDTNSAFITKCGPGQWALTFDDGPSPFTPTLLQTLKTANVSATFYVLGVQVEQPELAKSTKAAFDAGHMIASHTYDHTDLNTLTAAQVKDQMTRTGTLLKQITGATPNYMRPPFGNCGATCAAAMKELGMVVTTWDVDSNDWRFVGTPDEPKAFDAFTTALAAADVKTSGHMSLQHDIHQFSVNLVPKIIAAIKAKGFTFVTADKCAGGTVPAYKESGVPAPGGGIAGSAAGNGTRVTAASPTPTQRPVPTTSPNLQIVSGASTIAASSFGLAAAAVAALASM